MNSLDRPRPLILAILDGWGIRLEEEGNAIAAAATPNMDRFVQHYPATTLLASGIEVGLPHNEPGNSETGHRNIGAGKVDYQILKTIDESIEDHSFFTNDALLRAINHARERGGSLHLMGLVSDGGVHSHINHLLAILKFLKEQDFRDRVYIHVFTDGRDTMPHSASHYIERLEEAIGRFGVGKIASVTGRFYAMDRNRNWERTKAAYDMLTGGKRGLGASSPLRAIERYYEDGIFDEKIPPTAITRGGQEIAKIHDGDSVVVFNFRPDRMRQLTQAFVTPTEVPFLTRALNDVYFATFTSFDPKLRNPVAFTENVAEQSLGRSISENGLSQLRIAETEKYAHVTFYLSVGLQKPLAGEERVLIESSSAKDFALEPAMAAERIVDQVLQFVSEDTYDVYLVNFANADMVGHTGNLEAAAQACSVVDQQLGRLSEAVLGRGGALLITADHGNAEEMINTETGLTSTDHTSNPVPFYYVRAELEQKTAKSSKQIQEILHSPIGVLADVAPTVLDILRLDKPVSMTGVSLLGSLR